MHRTKLLIELSCKIFVFLVNTWIQRFYLKFRIRMLREPLAQLWFRLMSWLSFCIDQIFSLYWQWFSEVCY